jgi:hypothetical protein
MNRHQRPSPWFDLGWPVLAGAVTAAGLAAAYVWMGLVTTMIALALLELTFAPVAWSILTELGYATRDVIFRISPLWAFGSLAFVGLVNSFNAWALAVGAFVLLTSPLVQGWTRVGTRGLISRYGGGRDETRRQFDEIVARSYPGLSEDEFPY